MTNIRKTIRCIPFMVMLAALSGIMLLGFPNVVSAQRQVAPYRSHGGGSYQPYHPHGGGSYQPYYPHGGGSYQPYYPHRGGGYGGGGYSGYRGGGYGGGGYRGGGYGAWWVPAAIIGGAVALVANSVALVSNSLALAPNYYAPYYAAPPVYVQPAPSVPPGSFDYPR
jgi:hypothetical protein